MELKGAVIKDETKLVLTKKKRKIQKGKENVAF